jgi:hypothetical protein
LTLPRDGPGPVGAETVIWSAAGSPSTAVAGSSVRSTAGDNVDSGTTAARCVY